MSWKVELQGIDRGSSFGSEAGNDNVIFYEREMLAPDFCSRIVQVNNLASFRVYGRRLITLVEVA